MKKIITLVLFFIFPYSAFALSGYPATGSFQLDNINLLCNVKTDEHLLLAYDINNNINPLNYTTCEPQEISVNDLMSGNFAEGVVHYVELDIAVDESN